MARSLLLFLAVLALVVILPRLAHGDDDDPIVLNKKTSEWLKFFRDLRDAKATDAKEAEANIEKRRKVLEILRLGSPKAPGVLNLILDALKDDPSDRVRASAAQWLGEMAKKAKDDNVKPESTFEGLSAAIREDKSATVRDAAAKAFGDIARVRTDMRAAVPALTAAMKDDSMEVRANAAQCLGRIGRDASSAVDNLMAALLDKKGDRFSRGYAAIALVRVDPGEDRIPPALAEVVGDLQVPKGVREDAARALALLGKNAAPAVPTLAKVLSDKDPDVRQGAAAALAAVGPAASDALPAMRAALETEKEKGIRAQIIFALGTVGKDDPKAVESLRNALKDDNAEIILATIRALAAIGPAAKETLPALKTFTTDGRTEIREAAKDAIEKIQENP